MTDINPAERAALAQSTIARTLGLDRSGARTLRWKRWALGAAGLLVVAAAGWFWSMQEATTSAAFRTAAVQRGDLAVTVTATGNLQPINQVDVGSELSGIIKTVRVDFNDRVKAGQELARLDTAKLDAQRKQLLAALDAAQARVLQTLATIDEARNQLARFQHVRELSGGKVPSPQDFDAAQAAHKRAEADAASARAAVAQAQASLDAIETDLSKAIIRAPVSGVVLKRAVQPGQTVAASFQAPVLFVLAEDLTKMELHVNVDEADVGAVKQGQTATFTVDAYPDRSYPARIREVRFGAQTVQGVVTYETLLTADNADLSLRPGMTATADIAIKRIEQALLVPNAALRFTPPATEPAAAPAAGPAGGSLLSKLFPRPSRGSAHGTKGADTTHKRQQRVWILQDGQPVAISITVGATNGVFTEVTSGDLKLGMALLVDTMAARQ
jgi:HlyD family secretion protein